MKAFKALKFRVYVMKFLDIELEFEEFFIDIEIRLLRIFFFADKMTLKFKIIKIKIHQKFSTYNNSWNLENFTS